MNANNEEQLIINRVLHNEPEAFRQIVDRYNQQLFRVARSIVRNKESAEDVLQRAYLNAFLHLKQFEWRSSFRTWITQIVIREALHLAGRERKEWLDQETASSTIYDGDRKASTPYALAEFRQVRESIEAAIDQLPDSFRTIFVMREVEGQSTHEIAGVLGVDENLVRVRLFRAKQELKKSLTPENLVSEKEIYTFLGTDCNRLGERIMNLIKKDHQTL